KVGAGQHQVDVTAAGALHGLELAGQFRRGRLGEIDLGDELGVLLLVRLDGVLGERQVAGYVDDVDRYRARRQGRDLRAARRATERERRGAEYGRRHVPRRATPRAESMQFFASCHAFSSLGWLRMKRF